MSLQARLKISTWTSSLCQPQLWVITNIMMSSRAPLIFQICQAQVAATTAIHLESTESLLLLTINLLKTSEASRRSIPWTTRWPTTRRWGNPPLIRRIWPRSNFKDTHPQSLTSRNFKDNISMSAMKSTIVTKLRPCRICFQMSNSRQTIMGGQPSPLSTRRSLDAPVACPSSAMSSTPNF